MLSLASGALTACERPAGPAAAGASPDISGYLSPPTLMLATRDAAGMVTLSGHAPAEAEVRLQAPTGAAFSATANDDGDWSMQLPAATAARMFAFEGDLSGRLLHGEGAILLLPAPSPVAVLARAAYGALPIADGIKRGGPSLRITAVDYDGAGGGSISGFATPRASIRFLLDGQPVGIGQADDQGRFAILDLNARTPLRPGAHIVRVESPAGAAMAQQSLTVTPPKDPGGAAFSPIREDKAWRTDWRTPGGGAQTTLVFDAAALEAQPSGTQPSRTQPSGTKP